jgi:hypothetical protein
MLRSIRNITKTSNVTNNQCIKKTYVKPFGSFHTFSCKYLSNFKLLVNYSPLTSLITATTSSAVFTNSSIGIRSLVV